MTDNINAKLERLKKRLEKKHNIKILCMVECGSRAYGLHSSASDFDIRFVYIQRDKRVYEPAFLNRTARLDRLHNGFDGCDLVENATFTSKSEYPDKTEIDHHGWDITKAVIHLHEMNPSIVEWVYSTRVYYDDGVFLDKARELLCSQNRIWPLLSHHKGMARSHFEKYLENEDCVRIKKYMMCVRSCVMFKWLEMIQPQSWAPFIEIDFRKVLRDLDGYLDDDLIKLVRSLVNSKKNKKFEYCEKNDVLDELIEQVIDESSFERDTPEPHQKFYNKLLDDYFRKYFSNLKF